MAALSILCKDIYSHHTLYELCNKVQQETVLSHAKDYLKIACNKHCSVMEEASVYENVAIYGGKVSNTTCLLYSL